MKLKLTPEDFRVDELVRWDEVPKGRHAIYRVRKIKLTTFEAVRIIASRCNVPLDRVSYVGLKDRQGVTTQYLSVDGTELRGRVPGIHYELVGHAATALASENLLGNDFTMVVRDLTQADAAALEGNLATVKRHGLPNYFDDQRFGSVAAGQGFPARLLVQGDPEGALKLLVATPGTRDPLSEKKWKFLVQKSWGQWEALGRKWANRPGVSIVRHLRRKPHDFAGAWSCMPGKERAIHIFAYQSFVWNEAVAAFLREALPEKSRVEIPYVAGRHVFWAARPDEELPALPASFPLVDDATPIADERVARAVDAALRHEKLTRASFKIKGISGSFFKHEERPLVLRPERLVIAHRPGPDDRHAGRLSCTISFRLPPGGYATLVLKRLFPGSRPIDERDERRDMRRDVRRGDRRDSGRDERRDSRRDDRRDSRRNERPGPARPLSPAHGRADRGGKPRPPQERRSRPGPGSAGAPDRNRNRNRGRHGTR